MGDSIVPEWLTADFVKSCLESDKENYGEVEVMSHSVEPAVPPGNNYGSNMFRVIVQYKKLNDQSTEYSVSLIIKSPLTGEFVKQFGEFFNEVYEKEPEYYNSFINETYKICKHSIVPKYYSSPNPLCVVLEDLKTSNYEMVDRHNLLDFDHCRFYVKASAKLHALSVVVSKEHPEIIQSLLIKSPKLSKTIVEFYKVLALSRFQCMVAFLEDKPDYKEFLDVINELTDLGLLERILEDMEKSVQPLKALTQKDPWCTNIMFKYDESRQVVDAKLFDFQQMNYTSPVKELVTFLWMSANPQVRSTRLDDLCRLYCDSLNEHLADFGCDDRLSLEDMRSDMRVLSPHVLLVVCGLVPPFFADEPADFDVFTGNISNVPIKESSTYKLYQSNTFKKYYPFILDEMARDGIFDHIKEKIKQFKQKNYKITQNGHIV
uniref:CHK kinase-like domain-containing protein n=1 Tax=Graphocephala atropunctata TaxID=36148 RepID=A0A1B6M2F2_9HEMI